MTLCIAAECEYRGYGAIALFADWRAQTGNLNQPELMTGTDDIYKMREVGKATALLAGTHGKAIELALACKAAIQEFTETEVDENDYDLAVDGFMQKLRKVASAKRMDLIRTYVESNVGIPHSEFIKLPTEQYMDVWLHIRQRLNFEADLLIAHVSHVAVIVRLDRWGNVSWEHNYGVIGNGAEAARTMLCLQAWDAKRLQTVNPRFRGWVPLEECLYRITEAHLSAHKANPSSVGAVGSYQVLTANYRSTPHDHLLLNLHGVYKTKHQVPDMERGEPNTTLTRFQSFTTWEIGEQEPEKL